MLSLLIFVLLVMAGLFFAVEIFVEKDLFKSALGLAMVFLSSSGMILLLNQPLIALLQLLILVGGLSTYLIVAVASTRHAEFLHTNMPLLMVSFLLFGTILVYAAALHPFPGSLSNSTISQGISLAITQYYVLIYAMVFLIFMVSIGSILLIRRVLKIVV